MVPLSFFFFVLLFTIIPQTPIDAYPSSSLKLQPTQLVRTICNQTSEYSACVNSLYSDPRTPQADQYVLAYIAVGLAYNHAAATRDLISLLLVNATSSSNRNLQGCAADYDNAISKMKMASNDVNSETYFELRSLSGKASDSADHCQKSFPSLTARNKEFKGLCEIVGAVGKLFSGEIVY